MKRILTFFLAAPLLAGCAVGMALSGREAVNTKILRPGVSREMVMAELGAPQSTELNAQGAIVDRWVVKRGNEPSALRAIGHGALDFFTLGLWELAGTPIEMVAGKEDTMAYEIIYDAEGRIKEMKAYGDDIRAPKPAF